MSSEILRAETKILKPGNVHLPSKMRTLARLVDGAPVEIHFIDEPDGSWIITISKPSEKVVALPGGQAR